MISQLVSTLQTLSCLLIMLSSLTTLTITTFSSYTSAGIVFQFIACTCTGIPKFWDFHFNLHCLHDYCFSSHFNPFRSLILNWFFQQSVSWYFLHSALNTISSCFYGHFSNFQLFQDFSDVKCFNGKIAAVTACRFCLENATAHLTIVGKNIIKTLHSSFSIS